MSAIFISYRRDDSGEITGRIYDRLVGRFGRDRVFKDVDNIPAGVDFRTHLHEALATCAAVVVIIGDRWLSDGKSRLERPDDFVRVEMELALHRDVPILPVLVRGARMPGPDDLPPSLRDLAFRQAVQVRPDPDFNRDIGGLIDDLTRLVQPPAGAQGLDVKLSPVRVRSGPSAWSDPDGLLVSFGTFTLIGTVPIGLGYWLLFRASPVQTAAYTLAGAVLFGLFLALIYRGAMLSAHFTDQRDFITRLRGALGELGYFLESESDRFLAFKVKWHAGLLAGRITVSLDAGRASIYGPRVFLAKLRRRLTEPERLGGPA